MTTSYGLTCPFAVCPLGLSRQLTNHIRNRGDGLKVKYSYTRERKLVERKQREEIEGISRICSEVCRQYLDYHAPDASAELISNLACFQTNPKAVTNDRHWVTFMSSVKMKKEKESVVGGSCTTERQTDRPTDRPTQFRLVPLPPSLARQVYLRCQLSRNDCTNVRLSYNFRWSLRARLTTSDLFLKVRKRC
jgi:hypothetical protein